MSIASPAQIAANRANAQKSTGPRDTSATRYNATKHGLLAKGITELDDAEAHERLLADLRSYYQPVGCIEGYFVGLVAFDMLRGQRAIRFEAEEITAQLNPPRHKFTPTEWSELSKSPQTEIVEVTEPGLPSRISAEGLEKLLRTVLRYETTIGNSLAGNLRQLNQLQKDRRQREKAAAN